MKKSVLSLLAATTLLLPLMTSPLLAEEGQARTLTIKREGAAVRFSVPDSLTVHSSDEEPMDWDYAVVDDRADFDFGVRADLPKAGEASTVEALQAEYLKDVHEMYDPKITSAPDLEFTLADGTKVKGYLYQSEYWGHRIVVAFPLKGQIVRVEFHAKALDALRAKEDTMKAVIETFELTEPAK